MGLNKLRKGHFHTQIILNPFPFSISVPIGPWCKGQVSLPFVWPNQNPHKSLAGQPAFLNFIPGSYLFCTVLVSQNPHCWQTEQVLSGFWKNLGTSAWIFNLAWLTPFLEASKTYHLFIWLGLQGGPWNWPIPNSPPLRNPTSTLHPPSIPNISRQSHLKKIVQM